MRHPLAPLLCVCAALLVTGCADSFPAHPSVDQTAGEGTAAPVIDSGASANRQARDERPDEPVGDSPPMTDPMTGDPVTDDPSSDAPPADEPPSGDPPTDDPPSGDPSTDTPPCQDTTTGGLLGCYSGTDCCEGFCTYDGSSYMPGHCQLQVDEGGHCEGDVWCVSGHCVDGACQPEACDGAGDGCWSNSDCCGDLFCAEGGGYVPGSCMAPLADGQACWYHDWCESGTCTDGICTSESCTDNGAMCYEGEECCSGLCTWDQQSPYIPGECFSAQGTGSACLDDTWCVSGSCVDGACGEPTCVSQQQPCWSDGECCDGFCTYSGSMAYTPGVCQPLQPLNTFCLEGSWCESGACVDGLCKVDGCQEVDQDCHAGSDCCSGLCTYSGQGEQHGSCLTPQPQGAPCVADMWCASTSCVDGVCQAVDEVAVTFEVVYEAVFEVQGCASGYCHSSPFDGLYLGEMEEAYHSLTNGQSAATNLAYTAYVVPGDPEASLLLHKVRPYQDGDEWIGNKMPLGTDGLGPDDIALIQAWIAQGALP
ncbi:MAG: hypothetical protein ACPGU1_22695 [Myxococcota bacterium]